MNTLLEPSLQTDFLSVDLLPQNVCRQRLLNLFRPSTVLRRLQAVVAGLSGLAGLTAVSQGACDPVTITEQPQSVTVVEGCRATFHAVASGTEPITYQWFEEGKLIANATNAIYTTPPLRLGNNGNSHTVLIQNPCRSVESQPAILTVAQDTVPPNLLGAASGATPDQVVLHFSADCPGPGGGLAPASATDSSHYSLTGGLQVNRAELSCEGTTVILTLNARLSEGVNYAVTVTDVMDWAGNVIPAGSQASFHANALLRGALRRDVFQGLAAGSLAAFTNDQRFPYCPDESGLVDALEAPRNVGNRYGQRLFGLVVPPLKTNYTFFLASDEESALYLSSDDTAAGKQLIARNPVPTLPRGWGCSPGPGMDCLNRSMPIALESGHRYYIEAIMAENTQADHLAVAWDWSGDPNLDQLKPIPGTYLGTYGPAGGQINITQHPQNMTATPGCRAAFSVEANAVPAGIPLTYQWQRFSVDIPGANEASYQTEPLGTADSSGVYRCLLRAPGASRTSANASLQVTGDVQPLRLTGIVGLSPTRVFVFYNMPVGLQPGRYTLLSGQGVTISRPDPANRALVELSVANLPLIPGNRYQIIVQGIQAESGSALSPDPTVTSFRAQAALLNTDSLRLTPAGEQAILEWLGTGALESSEAPEGPWRDLPDVFSPYVTATVPTSCNGGLVAPAQFYRLRVDRGAP
ncbi:MAG TPA: hypothetical protein VNU68_32725 [Verrucomicrobiae bacterium]|nr:hypothetical protein [Verrucomicrobiae bacterium]